MESATAATERAPGQREHTGVARDMGEGVTSKKEKKMEDEKFKVLAVRMSLGVCKILA